MNNAANTTTPGIVKAAVAVTLAAVLLTLVEVVLLFSAYDWITRHSLAEDFPQGEQLLMESVRDNIITIIAVHCGVAVMLGVGAVLVMTGRRAGRALIICAALVLATVSVCSAAGLGIMSLAASHHQDFSGPTGTFVFAAVIGVAAGIAAAVSLLLVALPAVGRHMRPG